MRVVLLVVLAALLGGCGPKLEPLQSWSLAPRDNPLSRALASHRDESALFFRMNAAVEALQAVKATRPAGCAETRDVGCVYEVRLAIGSSARVKCERHLYGVDNRNGRLAVFLEKLEPMTCPATVDR